MKRHYHRSRSIYIKTRWLANSWLRSKKFENFEKLGEFGKFDCCYDNKHKFHGGRSPNGQKAWSNLNLMKIFTDSFFHLFLLAFNENP